jgi:hypothetical protein
MLAATIEARDEQVNQSHAGGLQRLAGRFVLPISFISVLHGRTSPT